MSPAAAHKSLTVVAEYPLVRITDKPVQLQIGGMIAATFLAVLFVPLFFRLVTRERRKAPETAPEPAPELTAG